MKILKQNKKSYYGNDCMIYRSVALIRSLENYIVLKHETVIGWCPCNDSTTFDFDSYDEALEYYESLEKDFL